MILAILLTLVPVALLIALGYYLKSTSFIADNFWGQAERLGYYVLLPALFFQGLATADIGELPIGQMVVVLVGALIGGTIVLVLLRPAIGIDGPGFTSIFQGGLRFNNYVAVSIVSGLFGAHGVALSAVCNAIIVPTVNILCVMIFLCFSTAKMSLTTTLKQLGLNPLLLACLVGILFQVLSLRLPPGVEPAIKALGQASLALGLLCVGAALKFSSTRKWITPLLISSAIKFIALPLFTLILNSMLGLVGTAAIVVVIFQTMPTASSSYIMARQLGGDAPLMAGITVLQTIIAGLAIPAVLILSGTM
ncbi:AEC family transporter [Agrobacterium vitis]|uniref:AEC family transporter n=1 Tax=Rhizobium/Agrobacterium group TaxID=227290 RepID=UPI0012E71B25|nr:MULTISPECIES: AEC family transporter [Rhizobium/Agrobacterium group]MCF1494384.1 AEC family transporter [Allorhizobium ampelinum]MUZ66338.1 AEC family transporter [Agrobacterium vitis]MVA45890.1 AEC family transporter [Agrobacterium vitis]